jgi:hypothetical protein
MSKKFICIIVFFLLHQSGRSQTNIACTNLTAQQIMLGNYNPLTYSATQAISHPDSISKGINLRVSKDSLHAYLEILRGFKTRNSGSDTISSTKGIGAARNWIYKKFQQFSLVNENRLLPSFLRFDMAICGNNRHKDVIAVLPGTDTTDKSIVLIEGHMDSRCASLCDTACLAEGMEDNGSGTVLVMELARVMSRYSYKHTIVFMATTAEEQGLFGAAAFANYAVQTGIKIRAVLNNDVIGGIFCGNTSSPPSCPGYANIDSLHVRMFSYGGFNSPHKGLARFIKLEYKEQLKPIVSIPMTLYVMTAEDRTGRSGDHIPFRQQNYTTMRFTAANENGDANVTQPGYSDRQHTSNDILGLDLNNDQVLDSFFVNFNYLARNTVINGNAAGMAAIGPATPDFTLTSTGNNLIISITQQQQYLNYRVGVRTTTYDWDSVYTFTGTTSFTINNVLPTNYAVSAASVDNKGVESLFSQELMMNLTGLNTVYLREGSLELLQNKPNPSDETTMISVLVNREFTYKEAFISIKDLTGKEVKRDKIVLREGVNELLYEHGYNVSGTFIYSLIVDGKEIASKKMVFTN